jgi:hypothetical protein
MTINTGKVEFLKEVSNVLKKKCFSHGQLGLYGACWSIGSTKGQQEKQQMLFIKKFCVEFSSKELLSLEDVEGMLHYNFLHSQE